MAPPVKQLPLAREFHAWNWQKAGSHTYLVNGAISKKPPHPWGGGSLVQAKSRNTMSKRILLFF
jgi:hypothetical protein